MENYTGLINSSAVQTYRLLENLLEWANSQRGKMPFNPVPVNLSQLFSEEILVLNEIAIGKSITLKSSFPDNLTIMACLLYTSPSPRDRTRSRMPSSA